jgi:tRNA threonylcarbamoyladenosine biosynthesis protein TsaE
MEPVVLRTATPDETREIGARVGRVAAPGDRFLLEGPFGAGKTTFVQGLAQGLEVAMPISSPSFVIETRHEGRLMLYHIDLYRLDSIEDGLMQSLEEDLFGDGVSAVEWPELLPARVREGSTVVRFEMADGARVLVLCTPEPRLRNAVGS